MAACAKKHRRSLSSAALLALLVLGIAAAAWVGVGPAVEHFERLSQDELRTQGTRGRVALWKDAAGLIRERPWTGSGLGSFEFAFPRVQSLQLTYITGHAHNDYLELTAELGLPAAAVVFALFFWIAARTFRAARRAPSSLSRALALGSLGGITALLVHSVADFNLYIPANALVFAVLLGMGYAQSVEADAPARSEPSLRAVERVPVS